MLRFFRHLSTTRTYLDDNRERERGPIVSVGVNPTGTFWPRLAMFEVYNMVQRHHSLTLRLLRTRLYVDHVFVSHGLIKRYRVRSRSAVYVSFFKEVFSVLGVKLLFSTANHPQTDRQTEWINRVLKDSLRTFINHKQSKRDALLPLWKMKMPKAFTIVLNSVFNLPKIGKD